MTSKEKTKFRASGKWKKFRAHLLKEHDYTCQICGIKKTSGLQVHHLDEAHYTELKDDKFVLVCSMCHKEVERLLIRKSVDIVKYCENIKSAFEATKAYKNEKAS